MTILTNDVTRARAIVLNAAGRHPFIVMDAWDKMKTAAGQTCNWDRLRQMHNLTLDNIQRSPAPRANSVAAMIETVRARTQARIRTHAAAQGYPLRPIDGGAA